MNILTDEEISQLWLQQPAGGAGIANCFARAIEAAIMAKFERVGSIIHGTEDSKFGVKDEITDVVDDDTGYWENRGYDLIPVYALKEKP